MPEIEIASNQRDFLDDLVADLEAEHVGKYGVVRYQDALQFLIDHYRDEFDGDAADDSPAESDPGQAAPSNQDRLEAMMNLLTRYEDKWALNEGEEGKYAVTLPDGATETVRTKDDVRALLFNHYG